MKYAILSDIHAYPDELERVLADAKSCGAEKFICLGDVVGYGPDPVRSIEIVRNTCAVTLMGNHDAAVAGVELSSDFNLDAQQGVHRHRELVGVADKAWLRVLPYEYAESEFCCAHGSLHNVKSFDYIEDAWTARRTLLETKRTIVFVGHTHVTTSWVWRPKKKYPDTGARDAFVVEDGCRYIVNVGSVGYPRYENAATYCLYDSHQRRIEFRRLAFDNVAYANSLRKFVDELPIWLSDRLEGTHS